MTVTGCEGKERKNWEEREEEEERGERRGGKELSFNQARSEARGQINNELH